jgi:cyclic-di-GMP-binding protein
MKLNIPAQTAPTSSSSPSNPRKLKKILSDLPNTNMGELTRQTFHLLRDQNRQTMAAKERLENLEMLRVFGRDVLDSLKKYFINRTLPLPDKSKKIINLNQSILQEFVYGYAIIAQQAYDDSNSVNDKTLSIAICRALNYLAEMLLRASEVYQPNPANLWYDAHQLHLLADSRGLADNAIFDEETDAKLTIANCYKRILLFSLARPISLRQSDCSRLFKELFEWSSLADLKQQADDSGINRVFSIRLFEDEPPEYLSENDFANHIVVRTLDTSRLVAHVNDLIAEKSKHRKKLSVGDEMPLETLMMLVNAWGENAERRFSRAESGGHVNVAIGLANACKAIQESKKIENEVTRAESDFFKKSSQLDNILIGASHDFFKISTKEQNLTLESIGDDEKQSLDRASEENEWDMVAKGRVLTDTYIKQKQLIDEEQLIADHQNADSHWQIVNISAGGYCLRWNSDDTSSAQIGELIALQEFDKEENFNWRTGVIRWMQFSQESGLEIGVQVLSPQAETANVQRANRPDEKPFDCIILPEIKALNQVSSTILPAHAFETGNKLVIKMLDNVVSITLGDTLEHTGSFTQFAYNNTELDQRMKKQIKKEEALKHKDDFDELWPTL